LQGHHHRKESKNGPRVVFEDATLYGVPGVPGTSAANILIELELSELPIKFIAIT